MLAVIFVPIGAKRKSLCWRKTVPARDEARDGGGSHDHAVLPQHPDARLGFGQAKFDDAPVRA
jgi:hypothetical protein